MISSGDQEGHVHPRPDLLGRGRVHLVHDDHVGLFVVAAEVEAALERDPALRERYRVLCRSLERIDEPPTVAAPAQMTARWHRTIDRAAAADSRRHPSTGSGWHLPSFAWGALAAALVLAVSVRLWFTDSTPSADTLPHEETIAGSPPSGPAVVPVAAFVWVDLAYHDRQSPRLLGDTSRGAHLLQLFDRGDRPGRDTQLGSVHRRNRNVAIQSRLQVARSHGHAQHRSPRHCLEQTAAQLGIPGIDTEAGRIDMGKQSGRPAGARHRLVRRTGQRGRRAEGFRSEHAPGGSIPDQPGLARIRWRHRGEPSDAGSE